jgi:hypothetical protein
MRARGAKPALESRFRGNDVGGPGGWYNKMMKIISGLANHAITSPGHSSKARADTGVRPYDNM